MKYDLFDLIGKHAKMSCQPVEQVPLGGGEVADQRAFGSVAAELSSCAW